MRAEIHRLKQALHDQQELGPCMSFVHEFSLPLSVW